MQPVSELEIVRLDNIQPQVMDYPVKYLYLIHVPLGQEKIQCIFCERDFVGPFTCRWIHLLGNTKDSTGETVFPGHCTIPSSPFFNKTMKSDFLVDLRKVMVTVPEHLHQKSWKKCETTLEKMTTDPSKSRRLLLLSERI